MDEQKRKQMIICFNKPKKDSERKKLIKTIKDYFKDLNQELYIDTYKDRNNEYESLSIIGWYFLFRFGHDINIHFTKYEQKDEETIQAIQYYIEQWDKEELQRFIDNIDFIFEELAKKYQCK